MHLFLDVELRRLHYDTANSAYGPTLAGLLALAPLERVLFGSDYPYLTVAQNLEDLAAAGLTAAQVAAIEGDNARRLGLGLGLGAR